MSYGIDAMFSNFMFSEHQRRMADYARQQRDEHFASTDEVPDLEFLPPDCSICGTGTEYDDGFFFCSVCSCSWPSNGQNGERLPEAER